MVRATRRVTFRRLPARRRTMTNAARFNWSNRNSDRGPKARGSIRAQLASIRKVVAKRAPEIKWLDRTVDITNVANPGQSIHLTAIAQGDDISNRAGDSIRIRHISFRAYINAPYNTVHSDNTYFRFFIVKDKQQISDTVASVADVFNPTNPVYGQLNTANLNRFTILWASQPIEARRIVGDTDITGIPTMRKDVQWDWTGDIVVRYNSTAATDIQKNGLYMYFLSNDATDTVDVIGITRIGFIDT